jgi:peroxiredoxin
VALSYGGPRRFRTQILAEHGFTSGLAPGSYRIYTGRSPLEFLSWHGAYPDWERVCRGPYSRVFADTRIAGRDARHIRCGNNRGYVWELWIDRQTGLLLKIVGQLDGDDSFLGGGISTSAKGGLEVQQLRYNPAFARGTFSAPRRAFDAAAAARQATLAKLPPFHAVFAVYGSGGAPGPISHVDEGWWRNEHTWRSKTLVADQRGGNFTGAGSFSVMAHGTQTAYNAHDHTFSSIDLGVGSDPAQALIDDYSPARCPIVGHARVARREADHRRCARYVVTATPHHRTWATAEYWIDAATGLTLRSQVNGHDLVVVRSIQYHPHFPHGTFRFVPPRGSHNLDKLENNPYYKTKLTPGKPAPNWHATTLTGKGFQLTDLRGKPALLLLLPDWCPCNEFIPLSQLPPLEQAYRRSHGATTVVWVDAEGTTKAAKTIARLNSLTFPVVVDKGAVEKAWAPQSFPKWVLLDSHGRVIEARSKPPTVAQLEQLLARG